MSLTAKMTKKDNGQTVDESTLTKIPSETIKINGTTYSLKNYDFSRTNIIDPRPAVNYYAGNLWGRKTYQISNGSGSGSGKITVEETGEFYGYEQYWGSTEAQVINYIIESEKKNGEEMDIWGGNATVKLSTTTSKQVDFVENIPNQISFKGGYVQKQHNEGILEYSCKLPEFDKKGNATDTLIETKNTLKLESFPVQTRLIVPELNSIKGHWAENQFKLLYSLEVLNEKNINPQKYISRAEFASAVTAAAKDVPEDTLLKKKTTKTSKKSEENIISLFEDVTLGNPYFNQINAAAKRGLMEGVGNRKFSPNGNLTLADAVTVLIRALGFENLAPNPLPVTTFRDNDKIPVHAKKAVYVAQKIGLIEADSKGYLNPTKKLTKADTAKLLVKFIEYMQSGIRKDYRERIVNY